MRPLAEIARAESLASNYAMRIDESNSIGTGARVQTTTADKNRGKGGDLAVYALTRAYMYIRAILLVYGNTRHAAYIDCHRAKFFFLFFFYAEEVATGCSRADATTVGERSCLILLLLLRFVYARDMLRALLLNRVRSIGVKISTPEKMAPRKLTARADYTVSIIRFVRAKLEAPAIRIKHRATITDMPVIHTRVHFDTTMYDLVANYYFNMISAFDYFTN